MIRALFAAVVTSLVCVEMTTASDTLLKDYIRDFAGRWVCTTVVDQDIDGIWKKGETLTFVVVNAPTSDLNGMHYQWQAEKEGKAVVTIQGITAWDPDKKCIRSVGFAAPGLFSEGLITRDGDRWVNRSAVTFANGSRTTSTVTISISDAGKTHTHASTDRVDQRGAGMPDVTRIWKKVSKNHEMLEHHLGWLIGRWTAQAETVEEGLVDVEAVYNWIADGEVITLKLTIGTWQGLSMIFFDPSDATIKMWGANSAGGNGQAVMRVEGTELVWTNTVYDGYGKKTVSDFAYIKAGDKTMYVKYVDEVDGQEKKILNTKK